MKRAFRRPAKRPEETRGGLCLRLLLLHFAAKITTDLSAAGVNDHIGLGARGELPLPTRNLRDWDLIYDFDTEAFERNDLAGMVGKQANGVQSQIGEYLRSDSVLVL